MKITHNKWVSHRSLNGKGPEPATKSGIVQLLTRVWIFPNCGSGSRIVEKFKKIYNWKNWIFFWKKLQFNGPKASIKDAQATGEVLKKPSALKKEHPALQNIYFFYICRSFLPSLIRIRIQHADPDPATQTNAVPCGTGSTTLWQWLDWPCSQVWPGHRRIWTGPKYRAGRGLTGKLSVRS
jgi:hypothetical protein